MVQPADLVSVARHWLDDLPGPHLLPVLLGLGVVLACGRNDWKPTGELGGPCYPNRTCNAEWVCGANDICVNADPCAGVTCSGHGACAVTNGQLGCACSAGYVASGLRCLECRQPDCGGCPPDMVAIPGQPACIDRYEATIFAKPDCTGLRYGSAGDDFPSGFPDVVESVSCQGVCRGCTTTAPTVTLYACSVSGIRATAFLTWFQAKRACENSGKHLCRLAEWLTACGGPAGQDYPYGPNFVGGTCGDFTSGLSASALTGAFPACEGGTPGLFDMSGNLVEWADDEADDANAPQLGGAFSFPDNRELECGAVISNWCLNSAVYNGFRCCKQSLALDFATLRG